MLDDKVRTRRHSPFDTEQARNLLKVARTLSATIGGAFFNSLVGQLARTLEIDFAYVAELTGGPVARLRQLAAAGCSVPDQFDQDLAGSAASQVLADGAVAWSKGARDIFPFDSLLSSLEAEGYAAVRLRDSSGNVLGLIAVIHRRRLQSPMLVRSVLETFAPRAAAELERKRAEDASQESEQRYRAFISSSLDEMWRIEFETPIPLSLSEDEQVDRIFRLGYVAECNEALSRSMGAQRPDDLVGTRFSDLFSQTDSRMAEELKSAVRSGYVETALITALGKEGKKRYRLRSIYGIVSEGQLLRIWGASRDLTDLKRAEQAAEASERRFRDVFEHIGLPALMLNPTGRITFCNESLAQLAHVSAEELRGKGWLDQISSPDEREDWSTLLSSLPESRAASSHFEQRIGLCGAAPRLIVWDTTVLRNEDDEPAGLAAIGRDITMRKALEARVSRGEKLESIGRLAGGVAHDFNNLLTVLMGRLLMLRETVDPELPIYGQIGDIQETVERCAALSQQLLAIGRRQHLRPELVRLNEIIQSEEALLRNMIGAGVELATSLNPSLLPVYADPAQIRRVLANLVTNASDAMPDGGHLTVSTYNIEIGAETPEGVEVPPGQYACLTVTDTGVGLTDDVKEHMFDPFYTTKSPGKGSGLGLSTVYGIVAQSDGHISVRSTPGTGTTMEILLPTADRKPGSRDSEPD